jgi:hypothetical protein
MMLESKDVKVMLPKWTSSITKFLLLLILKLCLIIYLILNI